MSYSGDIFVDLFTADICPLNIVLRLLAVTAGEPGLSVEADDVDRLTGDVTWSISRGQVDILYECFDRCHETLMNGTQMLLEKNCGCRALGILSSRFCMEDAKTSRQALRAGVFWCVNDLYFLAV